MSFYKFNLDQRLIEALEELDIRKPTKIQQRAIPPALNRDDVLGIAPTGTGKTFAFLLPSLHWLLQAKITHNNPSILILVPTRELVVQIMENLKFLSIKTEIFLASIVAGQRDAAQKRNFKELVDVVVATPGRLKQFLDDRVVNLKDISILIIDEVDRLLDMGFKEEVEEILGYLPHKNKRQTLLFCSTLPKGVQKFAQIMQSKSKLIEIGRSTPPKTISHKIYETEGKDKLDVLLTILKKSEVTSVIIFTRSKDTARITARNLLKKGLDCEELHGGLTQRQRNKAISNFANGDVDVLIATDVVSRGIDIPDISHIISFDVPKNYDDYVHRAGRTGRIDHSGVSIILASPEEFKYMESIKSKLGDKVETVQSIPRPEKKVKRVRKKTTRKIPKRLIEEKKRERQRQKGHRRYRQRRR